VKTTDLEVKTDRPAEMKTQVLELLIEGVRVRVRLDEQGRPITVTGSSWKGGNAECITRLALNEAMWRLRHEAEQKRKQALDADRTAKSTETKQENAREHWTTEWLAAAYNVYPDYGAERLMQEARKIAALNGMDEAKRNKINKYRAEQYLKTKRSK